VLNNINDKKNNAALSIILSSLSRFNGPAVDLSGFRAGQMV
jgi:hypothetical protein